jgi:hypothetical protein
MLLKENVKLVYILVKEFFFAGLLLRLSSHSFKELEVLLSPCKLLCTVNWFVFYLFAPFFVI